MPQPHDLSQDDEAAFALLEDAGRKYDEYLQVAGVGRLPVTALDEGWDDYVPLPVPLTLEIRAFG